MYCSGPATREMITPALNCGTAVCLDSVASKGGHSSWIESHPAAVCSVAALLDGPKVLQAAMLSAVISVHLELTILG